MCGIVAYIGNREAYPILIKGLKRLEYRGYDSSGVALISDNVLNLYKKQGKVVELEKFTEEGCYTDQSHKNLIYWSNCF